MDLDAKIATTLISCMLFLLAGSFGYAFYTATTVQPSQCIQMCQGVGVESYADGKCICRKPSCAEAK